MRRFLAVNLVFALFLGLLIMTLVLLLPMVWRQTALLVQEQLPHVLKNGEAWLRELPVHYPEVISLEQVNSVIAVIQRQVAEAGQGVLTLSLASIPNIVEVMVFLVLLPLLVFFFLKDKDAIVGWLMQFLPRRRRVQLGDLLPQRHGLRREAAVGGRLDVLVDQLQQRVR